MIDKRIFLVANSHIDPVWLWDKYEGIDEVINTFRSACDRLDEYPGLKFSASSICFYEWVERYAQDVFERMRAHIKAGRWEVTGGWWVEADCNLPSAESFFATLKKDLIYGRHYRTREEARRDIFRYIETFYNKRRLHGSLGYKSPPQFEAEMSAKVA